MRVARRRHDFSPAPLPRPRLSRHDARARRRRAAVARRVLGALGAALAIAALAGALSEADCPRGAVSFFDTVQDCAPD